tara:strand:- start:1409 stop:1945 length:537 start_codon:yes stop_codon:yes gene_type:complete
MKIFGHINDLNTGEPMPYVNIARVGSGIGATTNNSGFFTLEGANLDPNWEFTISHIGYTPLKRKASNMQGNSIYMSRSNTSLNEVVIKGTKYDPKKTTSWIEGLTAGWNLGGEVIVKDPSYQINPINPNINTPTDNNPYIQPKQEFQKKTNPLLWVGIGVGVLAIIVTIILVTKNNRQ